MTDTAAPVATTVVDQPVAVVIQGPTPIPVEVINPPPPPQSHVQVQATDPSLPARTTFQQDLTTAGQRQINLIWEWTQAIIALLVVTATMGCGIVAMFQKDIQIPTIIGVAFGMVTGFYFSRTNHEKVGGVGPKPETPYQGR